MKSWSLEVLKHETFENKPPIIVFSYGGNGGFQNVERSISMPIHSISTFLRPPYLFPSSPWFNLIPSTYCLKLSSWSFEIFQHQCWILEADNNLTFGNKVLTSCGLRSVFSMVLGEQRGTSPKLENECLGAKHLLFNIFGTCLFVPKFYINFQHCSWHMQWSSWDACLNSSITSFSTF